MLRVHSARLVTSTILIRHGGPWRLFVS